MLDYIGTYQYFALFLLLFLGVYWQNAKFTIHHYLLWGAVLVEL